MAITKDFEDFGVWIPNEEEKKEMEKEETNFQALKAEAIENGFDDENLLCSHNALMRLKVAGWEMTEDLAEDMFE